MLAAYLYYVKGNTKLNRQNYTLKNNPLGLVVYTFFRRKFVCFERPTLWGCQFTYAPRQRWRCTSTLPYQKTNPDGVICGRKWAIVDDFRRANVSLIFIYVKGNTKLNRQNYTLKNNPLGLVLWQGRVKMRSGLTLPKSSAKCNPLGLVFIYDCISPIIYANKSICQSSPLAKQPLMVGRLRFLPAGVGSFWKTNPERLTILLCSETALTLCINTALPKGQS